MTVSNRRSKLIKGLAATTTVAALAGLASGCGGQGQAQSTESQGTTSSQQQGSFDQEAVGRAIGKDLESKGSGVYEAEFPRTDIQVTSQDSQTRNVPLDPSLDLQRCALALIPS